MAVLNPQHLFEQAEKLIMPPTAGPPRQVDLRRAISAAYYGVFHFVLTAAADEFIGATKKNTRRYALAYRSIDHRRLRELCQEASRTALSPKYVRHAPSDGLGPDMQAFANAVLELQERRHAADYDPSVRIKTRDARLAIETARSALRRYGKADDIRRKSFLSLLVFTPR